MRYSQLTVGPWLVDRCFVVGVAVLNDIHLVTLDDPMAMAQLTRNRHLSLGESRPDRGDSALR